MDTLAPHIALKVHLLQSGMKQGDFAANIGIPQSTLSEIIRDRRKPHGPVAAKIERATGGAVPASSWWPE